MLLLVLKSRSDDILCVNRHLIDLIESEMLPFEIKSPFEIQFR